MGYFLLVALTNEYSAWTEHCTVTNTAWKGKMLTWANCQNLCRQFILHCGLLLIDTLLWFERAMSSKPGSQVWTLGAQLRMRLEVGLTGRYQPLSQPTSCPSLNDYTVWPITSCFSTMPSPTMLTSWTLNSNNPSSFRLLLLGYLVRVTNKQVT